MDTDDVVFNHLELMHDYQTQLDGTANAVDYLLKKGYSERVLTPYTNHADYLTQMKDRSWSEFKEYVNGDKIRNELCSSIRWRPVTGVEYQNLVSDENFIKRWN